MDKDTQKSLDALNKLITNKYSKELSLVEVKSYLLTKEIKEDEDPLTNAVRSILPWKNTRFPLYSESVYVGVYKDKVV